jgi:hypothetical protein
MKHPITSIDRQRVLWESASEESPVVLTDEQHKELMTALMELLLSSAAQGHVKDSDGGNHDGE